MKKQDGVEELNVIGGKYIAMAIGLASVFLSGYGCGKSITANRYKAIVAEMTSEYAKSNQTRYQAIAEAEQQARVRLQKQTEHIQSLMQELSIVRQLLIKERKAVKGKINDVSQRANAYCTGLPFEWVSIYNQVLGLTRSNNNTRSQNSHSSSSFSYPRSSRTINPRIQLNKSINSSINKLNKQDIVSQEKQFLQQPNNVSPISLPQPDEYMVTPKDLLSHIQDYGLYCRRIETQLRAVKELLENQQ